ncbi:MAG: hypothetical protein M1305_05245 [Candidatus Marsarchaeota archaeon]|nr:hypothetical protein [Candidatus Marsarchaeota archaeon]
MNAKERFRNRYFGPKGMVTSIQVCLRNDHTGTALGLLCAAIESMAFISLPDDCDVVCDHHFVAWAKKYLQPHKLGISPYELWTVRCSLLDGAFSKHDAGEDHKEREILFSWGGYSIFNEMRLRPGSRWHQILSIRADELFKALLIGADEFANKYVGRPENSYMVDVRLNQIFGRSSASERAA